MASGTISSNTGTALNLYIDWTSTSNSISISMYIKHYSLYASQTSGTLKVGGTTVGFTVPSVSYGGNSLTKTTVSVDQTTFSASGSSVTISASWPCGITYSSKYLGTITCSGQATLESSSSSGDSGGGGTVITPVTYSLSADKVNIGSGIILNSSVSGSSSAGTAKFYLLGYANNATYSKSVTFSSAPYTFTVPSTWAGAMSNLTAHQARCEVKQSGSSTTQTYSFTVQIPPSTVPSIGNFTAVLESGGYNGDYIQSKSKCKLTMSNIQTGDSYSTISSYSITGPQINVSASSGTTDAILSSGTIIYTAKVTDSRGRSATKTCSIEVLPYGPPIIYVTAARSSVAGQIDVNYTISCSALKNQNKLANVIIYYKKKTATSYTKLQEVSLTAQNVSSINGKVTVSNCDPISEYLFYAEATDTIYGTTGTSLEAMASTESRPINIGCNKGVAVGKLSTVTDNTKEGLFEVAWKTNFDSDITVNGRLNFNKSITLWEGSATPTSSMQLAQNIYNFSYITCLVGSDGIVLGSFIDSKVKEFHCSAIVTADNDYAGSNIYGAHFSTTDGNTLTLKSCATKNSNGLAVTKIVGWI